MSRILGNWKSSNGYRIVAAIHFNSVPFPGSNLKLRRQPRQNWRNVPNFFFMFWPAVCCFQLGGLIVFCRQNGSVERVRLNRVRRTRFHCRHRCQGRFVEPKYSSLVAGIVKGSRKNLSTVWLNNTGLSQRIKCVCPRLSGQTSQAKRLLKANRLRGNVLVRRSVLVSLSALHPPIRLNQTFHPPNGCWQRES